MESSNASNLTSDTSNHVDSKAESPTSISSHAAVEPEDWLSELQRLTAESVTWTDWKLPDDCDIHVPEDLVHRIDFKKPVSLSALQTELAEWQADIAAAKAGDEGEEQVPMDVIPLDQLSDTMENLVTELTEQRDRMKQQSDFLRQLDSMSQDAKILTLADESVDRAFRLMTALQLSGNIRRDSHDKGKNS